MRKETNVHFVMSLDLIKTTVRFIISLITDSKKERFQGKDAGRSLDLIKTTVRIYHLNTDVNKE